MLKAVFLKLGRVQSILLITVIAVVLSELVALPIGLYFQRQGVYIDMKVLMFFGGITPSLVAPLITWHAVGLIFKIHQLEQQMRKLASYDSLTNVFNRGFFREKALSYCELALRQDEPISLLEIDLDHFKNINDSYGHLIGDEILKSFAKSCYVTCQQYDLIGRLGGEEFVIVLPNTDAKAAQAFADRLQAHIANYPYHHHDISISYSVSIGIATAYREQINYDAMLSLADYSLYKAKEYGRNCYIAA